jgi:hypothetical protein
VRLSARERLAIGLWLVFGFVLWNDILDLHVRRATYAYLARRAIQEQGAGPDVSIDAVMRPAVQAGARQGTLVGVAVAAIGVAGVAWARRQAGR